MFKINKRHYASFLLSSFIAINSSFTCVAAQQDPFLNQNEIIALGINVVDDNIPQLIRDVPAGWVNLTQDQINIICKTRTSLDARKQALNWIIKSMYLNYEGLSIENLSNMARLLYWWNEPGTDQESINRILGQTGDHLFDDSNDLKQFLDGIGYELDIGNHRQLYQLHNQEEKLTSHLARIAEIILRKQKRAGGHIDYTAIDPDFTKQRSILDNYYKAAKKRNSQLPIIRALILISRDKFSMGTPAATQLYIDKACELLEKIRTNWEQYAPASNAPIGNGAPSGLRPLPTARGATTIIPNPINPQQPIDLGVLHDFDDEDNNMSSDGDSSNGPDSDDDSGPSLVSYSSAGSNTHAMKTSTSLINTSGAKRDARETVAASSNKRAATSTSYPSAASYDKPLYTHTVPRQVSSSSSASRVSDDLLEMFRTGTFDEIRSEIYTTYHNRKITLEEKSALLGAAFTRENGDVLRYLLSYFNISEQEIKKIKKTHPDKHTYLLNEHINSLKAAKRYK